MVLATILLIPSLVAIGFFIFGGKKFTLGEFCLQMIVQVMILGTALGTTRCSDARDVEVWNGRVDKKAKEKVSCSHAYICNCRSVSCGKDCTTTVCDICFEHSYDIDWAVYTTNNERLEIDRIDRQGLNEPIRWTAIPIGEPTSVLHSFDNPIKGSPGTLFRREGLSEKYTTSIPAYPSRIYDYYRLDRLVTIGVTVEDAKKWNEDLMELNADLGKKKEVNNIIVIVRNQPEEYFYALQQAWIGSKKNDAVLVVSVDDTKKIQWVNVMAWTQTYMSQVTLADAIRKIGKLDRVEFMKAIRTNIDQYYDRKSFKEFEYLKHSFTPTKGQYIFFTVLGLIVSIGLGIVFLKNDHTTDDEVLNNNKPWR